MTAGQLAGLPLVHLDGSGEAAPEDAVTRDGTRTAPRTARGTDPRRMHHPAHSGYPVGTHPDER